MRLALAVTILSQTLPLAVASKKSFSQLQKTLRRKLQQHPQENLGGALGGDNDADHMLRIHQGLRERKRPRQKKKWLQAALDNQDVLQNQYDDSSSSGYANLKKECDPSDEADIGIFGCGADEYCAKSEDSKIGGICVSNAVMGRSLQIYGTAIEYCDPNSDFYAYGQCDCTYFDSALNQGSIACIPLSDYCIDGTLCGDILVDITISAEGIYYTEICYDIKDPYAIPICYLYDTIPECAISVGDTVCQSCEVNEVTDAYGSTYGCFNFDCSNTVANLVGNDCEGDLLTTAIIERIENASEVPSSTPSVAPIPTMAPTRAPITPAPATSAPVSPAPVTNAPISSAPVTSAPTTPAPATASPTRASITPAPVTSAPATSAPISPAPVTDSPTRPPVTPAPITSAPITSAPVTPAPITPAPATASPTRTPVTPAPVTSSPVTPAPTTPAPVTDSPTSAPATPAPITSSPVTPAPTTLPPTISPVTPAPITSAPVTPAPATPAPVTPAPTPAPVSPAPITSAPATSSPITTAPISSRPVTPAPVTDAPAATPSPITDAPATPAPVTTAPTSGPPVIPPATITAPVTLPPTKPAKTSPSPVNTETPAPVADPSSQEVEPTSNPTTPTSTPAPVDDNTPTATTDTSLQVEESGAGRSRHVWLYNLMIPVSIIGFLFSNGL